jgi:ASPIC/UnbV protein/VCBS repeat protein
VRDPRWAFGGLLVLYAVLGCTLLGFNRSPAQILWIVGASCLLDFSLAYLLRGQRIVPLSACITGLSLALLLNYAHGSPLLLFPVYLAIGSKYVFTYRGKHVFNPSLFGVAVTLLLAGHLVSPAPAYQWGGSVAVSAFLVMAALMLFVFRIGRTPLILSFLLFYTLQTGLRAYVMRWHLPPETLFVGTLTSAPFFLFTFYMITDPQTSPSRPRDQVLLAFALAVVDLFLHKIESLYTFYYAAFFIAAARFAYLHLVIGRQPQRHRGRMSNVQCPMSNGNPHREETGQGPDGNGQAERVERTRLRSAGIPVRQDGQPQAAGCPLGVGISMPGSPASNDAARSAPQTPLHPAWVVGGIGLLGWAAYALVLSPTAKMETPGFQFAPVPESQSGITARLGTTLEEVDPRLRHIAKWILSVGDSVAVGDYDGDGLLDLFLAQPLKVPEDRAVLYRNRGGFRFERVPVPCLEAVRRDPERHGLVSGALFVDYDSDGDQDLFLAAGFGRPLLLRNTLRETGTARFADATAEAGIEEHSICLAAQWLDADRDGRLDLLIANAMNPYLPDYPRPTPLNVFRLPQPEYPGDRRMFRFMHSSWYNATNGGRNVLYRSLGGGRFRKLDSREWGMPETHWSLAAGTGDLNRDGWTDLYVANDFGPDDLYLNRQGRSFQRVQGRFLGSIGRDTYKGMNASLGDVDRDGDLDIYVSNVHEPLQAEGSLLWLTRSGNSFIPEFSDEAAARGALNERRFGWGGAMGDLNNDGWVDITQANGMVDDTPDRRYPRPRDYWYVNEKVMRSGPEIHTYADMWGDLRGYSIFGKEANRIYLNRGDRARPQFVDVAAQAGWTERTNSRGIALADLDNDGALDAAVTHPFAPPSLYRNTPDSSEGLHPHWIGFRLVGDGVRCSREAAGSVITVSYIDGGKPVRQMREIQLANGFSAQGDRRAHFGLGSFSGPVTVRVSWYGGPTVEYRDLQPDRYHTLLWEATEAQRTPSGE